MWNGPCTSPLPTTLGAFISLHLNNAACTHSAKPADFMEPYNVTSRWSRECSLSNGHSDLEGSIWAIYGARVIDEVIGRFKYPFKATPILGTWLWSSCSRAAEVAQGQRLWYNHRHRDTSAHITLRPELTCTVVRTLGCEYPDLVFIQCKIR